MWPMARGARIRHAAGRAWVAINGRRRAVGASVCGCLGPCVLNPCGIGEDALFGLPRCSYFLIGRTHPLTVLPVGFQDFRVSGRVVSTIPHVPAVSVATIVSRIHALAWRGHSD